MIVAQRAPECMWVFPGNHGLGAPGYFEEYIWVESPQEFKVLREIVCVFIAGVTIPLQQVLSVGEPQHSFAWKDLEARFVSEQQLFSADL